MDGLCSTAAIGNLRYEYRFTIQHPDENRLDHSGVWFSKNKLSEWAKRRFIRKIESEGSRVVEFHEAVIR